MTQNNTTSLKKKTNKIKAQILSGIVILAGIAVTCGWFFDIGVLKSILPGWVTMKFITAAAFIFSGIAIYFMGEQVYKKGGIAEIVLPLSSMVILLLAATALISSALGVNTGVERMFVKENIGALKTTEPGVPSPATMGAFILIAVTALLSLVVTTGFRAVARILGGAVTLIGLIGLFGYLFNVPALYYSIEGISTAMAFHSAALFVLCGTAIRRLGAS